MHGDDLAGFHLKSAPLCPSPTTTTAVTQEALRVQDDRSIASTAKAVGGDIWGEGEKDNKEEMKAAFSSENLTNQKEPSTALTQRGFMILVKLIEDLQFEKELEHERGVGLVPGPVCVV